MAAEVDVDWSDINGGADGPRNVLFIVSEGAVSHPDVVRRRPAIELTEEVRGKLEDQGIPRHQQQDDLAIVKARYALVRTATLHGVEESKPGGEKWIGERERVLGRIANLVNNYEGRKGGGKSMFMSGYDNQHSCLTTANVAPIVYLHYIGDGRRLTGDWCFQDGFITFNDLATLYLERLTGRIMTIVSDCSHSGSWVRECMTFLDQQGVGPCGHSAKEKGILLKVYASCLSYQIPRQLAHSVYAGRNDKTGRVILRKTSDGVSLEDRVANAQHTTGYDFTKVRCGQKSITDDCRCLPRANWHTWRASNRIYTINDGGKWQVTLVVDDDYTNLQYLEDQERADKERSVVPLDPLDYGTVLKSSREQGPTDDEKKSAIREYQVYK